MIFGTVPFKNSNIEYLLYEACNKIPSFKHENQITRKSIEISDKLKELILALIKPNAEDRISHSYLFSIVIEDPTFDREYGGNVPEIYLDQSGITQNSAAPSESIYESFL